MLRTTQVGLGTLVMDVGGCINAQDNAGVNLPWTWDQKQTTTTTTKMHSGGLGRQKHSRNTEDDHEASLLSRSDTQSSSAHTETTLSCVGSRSSTRKVKKNAFFGWTIQNI